jgi:hypothetical protein
MNRIVRMSQGFLRARARLGLLDSESQKSIGATVGLLSASELPGAQDAAFMMPPSILGYLRRIPWLEVSIGYAFDDNFLFLLTIKST